MSGNHRQTHTPTEFEIQLEESGDGVFCASLTKTLSSFALLRYGRSRGWDVKARGFLRRHYGDHEFARALLARYEAAALEQGWTLAPGEPADPSLLNFLCHHGGLPYLLAPPPAVITEAMARGTYDYDRWCHEREVLKASLEASAPVLFEPGVKYCYSEVFLTLMSGLLAEVDGLTFPQLFERAFPPALGVVLHTNRHGYMAPNHGWHADRETIRRTFRWMMGEPEFATMTDTSFARSRYIRVGCNIETDVSRGPVGHEWWWGGGAWDEGGCYYISVCAYPGEDRVEVRFDRDEYIMELPRPPQGYVTQLLPNPRYARYIADMRDRCWAPVPPDMLARFAGVYSSLPSSTFAHCSRYEITSDGELRILTDDTSKPVAWVDGRPRVLSTVGAGPSTYPSTFQWHEVLMAGEEDKAAASTCRTPVMVIDDDLVQKVVV